MILMTTQLPTSYYVYLHKDPITNKIVYVGKGIGGRAWDVTRCRGQHKEHQLWMQTLMSNGYIPTDWVTIIHKNLTEQEAFSKEKEYLHTNGLLLFNRQSGERQHQAKLKNYQAIDIYLALQLGIKPNELSTMYKVSKATIYMIKKKTQWKTTLSLLPH